MASASRVTFGPDARPGSVKFRKIELRDCFAALAEGVDERIGWKRG